MWDTYLWGILDISPGPALQQQPHPIHIPSLHGEKEGLHGHLTQVGISSSTQQQRDGQPAVFTPAGTRRTVSWDEGNVQGSCHTYDLDRIFHTRDAGC